MRCWKCKQDMPEGLKYCGNCGVHMNRAVHMFQWLFSKKGLPVLIILLALIAGGIIWAVSENVDFPDGDIHVDLPVGDDDREPLENMYDFGVYPDVDSYIPGNIKGGGVFQNEDLYTFVEGGDVNFHLVYNEERQAHDSVVVGEYPHRFGRYRFVRSLEDKVWEYLELLDEKPFYFELIHEEGSWYFYRYTGVQEVYALEQPDWVDTDLGEFHLMISIEDDGKDDIFFSIRTGLGLESIYREEQEDILNDVPFHRDTRIVLENSETPSQPEETEPEETEPETTEVPEPELSVMMLPSFLDSCQEGEYKLSTATDYNDFSLLGFRGMDMTCEYAAEAYVHELEKLGYTVIDAEKVGAGNRYGYKWYLASEELPENELQSHSPCHVYVQVTVDTEFNTCAVEIHVMMGIEMSGITTGSPSGDGET